VTAPEFIPYTDAQVGDHPDLIAGHHAAVDLDDDEGMTLAIVAGSYDNDGETGVTATLRISTLAADRIVVELHDGTLYDGPPEMDGISAAAVAKAVRDEYRRAMQGDYAARATVLTYDTIDKILTDLGL
jgi:hypothetical protein